MMDREVREYLRHRYENPADARASGPQVPEIRWGPAWGGAVIGAACFAVVSALWVALAWGAGGSDWWKSNLEWWIGGTAVGAFLLAGAIAGSMSRRHTRGDAVANAVAAWGLATLGTLIVVLPLAFRDGGAAAQAHLSDAPAYSLWVGFGAVALGLCAAVLAGAGAESGRGTGEHRDEPEPPPMDATVVPPRDASAGSYSALGLQR